MLHVFVETNFVFGYAAPAHHKRANAVALLDRARSNELELHLPALCLAEARHVIVSKCQPRHEADAVRAFLSRAKLEGRVPSEADRITREVLDRFEHQVREELSQVDDTIASLRSQTGIEVFPLSESMLQRTFIFSEVGLSLKPFDEAILAAILVRAEELRVADNDAELCFCETDADLQPWDKLREPKRPLVSLYDTAEIWVYENFDLDSPKRPAGWPGK